MHTFLSCLIVVAAIATPLSLSTDAAAAPRRKPAVAAPPPPPPAMRLGDAVKPLAYEAELTIVPTQERFSGHLVIHVEIAKPTDFFWMNATRLDIRSATVVAGGKGVTARIVPGGRDFVGLRFAAPLAAGRAVITIDYEGAIDRVETAGIFKQQDGDAWYTYTQFQPTEARRAFPSFDEPQWKTPWHLTLVVPASDVAAANTPIVGEEPFVPPPAAPEPAPRKGTVAAAAVPAPAPAMPMKRVRFAPTLPLPTYLVAFAVGPFDVVDGGRAGKKGTPLRYLVPRGRAGEAAYAREATPKLLEQLEDYFGQPYPFDKLDSVAIPITVGFGAMENVGLITYQLSLMLSKPEQESEQFRRWYASIAAHEIAHMWFGNLVTMQWWNDVWLNESFATWLSAKIVDRANPTWQMKLYADERRQEAIATDRLAATRQVRQAVESQDDLGNAFDSISYEKGAVVLSMFEGAVGEERFRNGVRRYISEHARGNARAEDFFGAITQEAGPENAATIAGFRTFIEQPGVPRLAAALDCGTDGRAPPRLVLNQSRYLPSRPPTETPLTQRWAFPACFQFGRGGDFNESCTLVTEARTVVPLPAGEVCPQWVLPNRGGAGYFVSSLPPDLTQQLVRTPLLPPEAIPALHDATTLVAAGQWPADVALDFAARFAGHRLGPVAEAATGLAGAIRPSWFDDAAERDGFAKYVQKNFGARARGLGWLTKASDREGDSLLRAALVPWVADQGADPTLRRDAARFAKEWATARSPFPPNSRPILLTAARLAQGPAGRELLDAYIDALGRTTGGDRNDLLAAVGSFRDPVLAEVAWDALLDKGDARDGLLAMRQGASKDEVAALQGVRYLKTHYDAVVRRLPEYSSGWLPRLGIRLCDAAARAEFDATFGERAGRAPGGARNYAQASEEIGVCVAARQSQRTLLKSYVARQ